MRKSVIKKGLFFVCIMALIFLPGGTFAKDALFDLLPSDSLFCLRVNNYDYAMGQMDQFLSGIAPMSLSMAGRMPLAQLLGDPSLNHVKMTGSFAAFGVAQNNGGIAVALMIPIEDFDAFVEDNPNCKGPDENGICRIVAPQDNSKVTAILTKVGDYALATWKDKSEELAALAKSLKAKQSSLGGFLGEAVTQQASKAPAWAYGNVQRAGQIVRPMIEMGFAQMQEQMKQAAEQGQGPGMEIAAVIDMYREIIDGLMSELEYVSVAIQPSAQALQISPTLVAVEGTTLARIMSPDPSPKPVGLLEYLPNGAAINFSCKTGPKESWKLAYEGMFDILKMLMGDKADESQMKKLRDMTNRSIDAMGGSMAFSMGVRRQGTPPFSILSVTELSDPAAYRKILDENTALAKEGVFNDLYKWMGMEMDFQVQQNVVEIQGEKVDAMKIGFTVTGDNEEMKKAIEGMYGEGLEMYLAVVGDKYIGAMGPNNERMMGRLIGRIKSGRVRPVASEMQAALDLIGGAEKNELIMTLNVVRLMRMGMNMAKRIAPADAPIPDAGEAETSSNIVIAGRTGAVGRTEIDIVVPKAHVLEIKKMAESMEQSVKQPAATPASVN
ncbi:MAG: hypothetical protein JW828_05220 [Sedimentisphaerales bacterium]|nr:hypothetical protein [Sedimentisphaerales bacterium]